MVEREKELSSLKYSYWYSGPKGGEVAEGSYWLNHEDIQDNEHRQNKRVKKESPPLLFCYQYGNMASY